MRMPTKSDGTACGKTQPGEDLQARGIVHEEEMDEIRLDADQSLRGVGDDRRQADDEGHQRDRQCARTYPHQNHRRHGDDGDGLQQDGVGVEHAPYPAGLREEQRDQHSHNDAGYQASCRLLRGDGQRRHQRGETSDDCPAHGQRRGQHVGWQMQDHVKALPKQQEPGEDGERVEQGDEHTSSCAVHPAQRPGNMGHVGFELRALARDAGAGKGEVDLYFLRDAARRWREHDDAGREKDGFGDGMGDEDGGPVLFRAQAQAALR